MQNCYYTAQGQYLCNKKETIEHYVPTPNEEHACAPFEAASPDISYKFCKDVKFEERGQGTNATCKLTTGHCPKTATNLNLPENKNACLKADGKPDISKCRGGTQQITYPKNQKPTYRVLNGIIVNVATATPQTASTATPPTA